tara:strand:+ start:211 stop:513 length:303 start_codon:yes stop_codon:yes gene_type:complete
MKLKNILNEAEDDWTGKDLIDTAKSLVLAKKSVTGAIRNVEKLEKKLNEFKNKPQGRVLLSMSPSTRQVVAMRDILKTLDKLDDGMGAMFQKAWKMLKRK